MKKKEANPHLVDVDVKRGINAFIDSNDGRPDLFEADEDWYHFPCGECKHKSKDASTYCKGCCHYVV